MSRAWAALWGQPVQIALTEQSPYRGGVDTSRPVDVRALGAQVRATLRAPERRPERDRFPQRLPTA